MIKVNVDRQKNMSIKAIEISGHAESGPYGQDLVCAAVSAVSIGIYNAVCKLCDTDLPVHQSEDDGYLQIEVPKGMEQEQNAKIQLLLEGMIVSLQTIESDYEKYIQIIQK
jgi:uncharacterized protein YsxB (DUF464 family)